jgi:RNA polymerase sigma-70 factor (ECF subfamily)
MGEMGTVASPGGPEDQDDPAIRQFLGGDVAGFEALARAHQDRVYRWALALLGRREDARDATQEVFLRAFTGLRAWRFESRLTTWLFRMTLNVCREARRRDWRERLKQSRFLRLVVPRSAAPTLSPSALDGGATLLQTLPPRQRQVVLLRIYEDLSVAETAAVLGIPEGTVRSNFFKAVGRLRRELRVGPQAAPVEDA